MESCHVRIAGGEDAEKLLAIYAPYVENTAITFEYEVPSIEEFRERIEHTLSRYPYLVAERGGEILGYAYASAFKERAAYAWAVETSIYIRTDAKHLGLGKLLYTALEGALRLQNITNVNACIAHPTVPDEYLTLNSEQFHEHLGYSFVGRFTGCAYKFGRWYDMVWMEKELLAHTAAPAPVIPFPELSREALERAGLSVM